MPELKLDNVKIEKGEEGWLVQGDLRQANDRAFRFPVDLEIVSAGAATHKRVWIDRREAPFQFTTEDKPDRIIVDPDFDVLKIQKMPPALTTGYPNVLLVYGTLAEGEANRAAAEKFDRGFLGLGGEVIKADAEVRNEDLSTPVVILFGRPETNLIAQRLAGDFPVTFDGPTFTYGGVTYEKPTQGVAQVIEKPDDLPGLVVMYAGLSGEATQSVCDKAEWREELGGWFLVDVNASYVIFDADGHKRLLSGDWEGYDPDLVWELDEMEGS